MEAAARKICAAKPLNVSSRCLSQPPIINAVRPFHILTKPVGPICNLDCKYCFYLEKEKLYPGESQWRMSDAVLCEYIRQYIHSQPVAEINFAWQGGEPTLLGVDFFRKAVALQQQFANGKIISNAIQTNGTLLDDEWCEFLAQNKFLVGLSIDGPHELHDRYRVDKRQQPTFDKVMRGLELLKKHGVEFNTLTVVNSANSQSPLEVYRFLKSIGSQFLQFIPLVERTAPAEMKAEGYDFAAPPLPGPENGRFTRHAGERGSGAIWEISVRDLRRMGAARCRHNVRAAVRHGVGQLDGARLVTVRVC